MYYYVVNYKTTDYICISPLLDITLDINYTK